MGTGTDTPLGTSKLIASIEETEMSALEAVRKFVDTVDGAFPEVGEEGSRQKIIDSAFKMVEQLVGASNKLAQEVLGVTEKAMSPTSSDDD